MPALSISAQPGHGQQLLYPPVSEQRGISVAGQGRASVPASRARIDVLLTNRDRTAPPPQSLSPEERIALPEPPPITLDSLQGTVEALEAIGVPSADIEARASQLVILRYPYNRIDDAITVTVAQPTRARVNEIVNTIDSALKAQRPQQVAFVDDIYVQYIVDDCAVLEQKAYASAISDAQLRAQAIADSLGVTLAAPPFIGEFPFLGRFVTPCNEETDIVRAIFGRENTYYNPEAPAEVEVFREVLVTYPVE
ncbi:MAG: SIMPL domain-containing protein [Cyanobacteria bacterium P01_H01_bin.58]